MPSLHGPKEKPDILMWSWRMSTLRRPHARVSDVSQARGKEDSTVLTSKLPEKRFVELMENHSTSTGIQSKHRANTFWNFAGTD